MKGSFKGLTVDNMIIGAMEYSVNKVLFLSQNKVGYRNK
jgi:hypothetical protein